VVARGAERGVVAVAADVVVIFLLHDRVRGAVAINGGREVPAEPVRAEERAGGGELHQVALRVVVERVGAVKDVPIREHHRRRGGVIDDGGGAGAVVGRIDAGGGAGAAA